MRFYIRFRVRSTGAILVRNFDTSLSRTAFIIGFEGNGLGTVLDEWEA